MSPDESSSIKTRPSLLSRLKAGDNNESWKEFYRIYGKLVRDFATHAGLTDTEADEVVQETAIAMSRHLPGYRYDPKVCRFKTWLLNQASWRIKDQFKTRKNQISTSLSSSPDTGRTAKINRIANETVPDLDNLFEAEWRKNIFALAFDRARERFSLKQMQIFDLLVLKEWPGPDVAKSLGVSLANVYVTRHRIAAAIKKEARRLERDIHQVMPPQKA